MTVFENLVTAACFGGQQSEKQAWQTARDVLEQTGLLAQANKPAGGLTLLNRKRLELARALATQPELLLLDEIAGQDLAALLRERDGLPLILSLQALAPARQANALRFWLKSAYGVVPSTAQLCELQSQIAACVTRGHRIHIKVGRGFVERRGAVLTWYNPTDLPL